MYVAYNGWIEPVLANLPAKQWYIVADTSAGAEAWGNIHAGRSTKSKLDAQQYTVAGRSAVLLIEK